jgi:lysophospholipid acyltransferase (LPLAT)-like uncharacterized protein
MIYRTNSSIYSYSSRNSPRRILERLLNNANIKGSGRITKLSRVNLRRSKRVGISYLISILAKVARGYSILEIPTITRKGVYRYRSSIIV